MYKIVYIGEIIKKRINIIKNMNDVKLYIFDDDTDLGSKLNGIAVDLFVIHNNECMCSRIKQYKMYHNSSIITMCDTLKSITNTCESDLIATKHTTNFEFEKSIKVLLRLKSKNDEVVKEEILHKLEVKDNSIRINKIYDAMNEGIIITDNMGHIMTINKTAKLICNYKHDKIEHIDDVLKIYVNDIKLKLYSETYDSRYKKITNSNAKLYVDMDNDKFIHISLSSSKITNSNNEIIGILVIFQNISKEYNIVSKLKDSEENYKRIYDNAPDIIYTHDINGVFTSINRTTDFGYSISEVVGHSISDFMSDDSLEHSKKQILHKINNPDSSTEYEIDVLHKEGYPIRLEIKSILNENKYGEYEIFSTARNITDKVESRHQLKMEQERYKQMFFNTKSSIIVFKNVNNEYHIIDYNIKGELLKIVKSDDIKNKNIIKLHNVYREIKALLDIIHNEKRENFRVDEFCFDFNNDKIYLNLFLYKLKHSDEIVLIYDNITETRLLINQYEEAKNKAKESDHLKSMFLSNISHEIRTPMNAIKGYSTLLKEKIDDVEKQMLYASYIHESSDALLTILNDILEISLIENGTVYINNDYFQVTDFVRDIEQEAFAILKEKKKAFILLNVIIDDDAKIQLCSDIRRLKQIMLNIIDNAIKFTDRGVIEIKCSTKEDKFNISVRDTGIGINADAIDKIFDRFYKINNAKLKSGTGLGLAISSQLTKLLDGNISVESEVGDGATFSIEIPIESTKTIIEPVKRDLKLNWENKNILIVEDKAVNFRLLEMYLEHTGANVERAEDGYSFYQKFNDKYDIILLDVQLPDTTGFELLDWIRKNGYNTPVIVQTAFASNSDEDKAYRMGANGFMTKPIKKTTLIEYISEFINT